MKFNTRVLVSLVATNQLALAAPVPGAGMSKMLTSDVAKTGYDACVTAGVACGLGGTISGHLPASIAGGATTLIGVAGNQYANAKGRPEAMKAIKDGAVSGAKGTANGVKHGAGAVAGGVKHGAGVVAGGVKHGAGVAYDGACAAGKKCKEVAGKATAATGKAAHDATAKFRGKTQSHDIEMGHRGSSSHHRRAANEYENSRLLAVREPEPEPEFNELAAREPATGPNWDELD